MQSLGVKNLSTVMVSILVCLLMGSGFYNTYVIDFRISKSLFDDSKYTIVIKDTLPIGKDKALLAAAPKRPSRVKSYAKRRPRVYKNAVEVKDPRETAAETNEMAHIKSDLNLELIEFSNAKHFKKVLKQGEAEGSLVARDGYIEALEIFLPNEDEITADFTEMNGNVFTYDHGGETYSGMLYQSGNSNYTVTLVNGPYQGSRMKFVSRNSSERALSYAEIIEEDQRDQMREEEMNEPVQDQGYQDDYQNDNYYQEEAQREEPDAYES